MPRLFIALQLPVEVKDLLRNVQAQLRRQIPHRQIRWQDVEKSHLTLRFLGNVSDADLPICCQQVTEASQRWRRFDLETSSLGVFPSRQRPSVLWLGVSGDLQALTDLHDTLSHRLSTIGSYQETKGFHPHLTLGRVRHTSREVREQLLAALEQIRPNPVSWQADRVEIIESELHRSGARYKTLATGEFKGP
ncbi:MAG: RNA 2',3'-cyclic phosphodiesterase [Trueperaceae bacterium]|nr:MAG: RNA 2',3'-cyclic phosphodiesterase [Trueperaceae bacterium]